jgi:hypothetical protein
MRRGGSRRTSPSCRTYYGWPLAARAQRTEQVRRIGVLMSAAIETDQQAGVALFKETLHQLDWINGRNKVSFGELS